MAKARARQQPSRERVVVGVTGASGIVYGVGILDMLREAGLETHLVVSKAAELTLAYETRLKLSDLVARADVHHRVDDVGASIASGSFRTRGMIVAPCSVRTMSEIATGVTTSLLTRAADVALKERRPLVLLVRETPLHAGHLETMLKLARLGAIIAPPVPAFYAAPASIDDLVAQTCARTLDLLGIDAPALRRWSEDGPRRRPARRTP